MLLINPKTGRPEEMTEDALAKQERKISRKSSYIRSDDTDSLSLTPKRSNSSFGRSNAKRVSDDGFVSEITRTSDIKKKFKKSSQSSFGVSRRNTAEPGEITRTSDNPGSARRSTGSRSAVREKPNHSSKSYAIFLLSKRDYSAAVLRNKIVTRGYSEEEADEAMAFVISNKYQSDERYAGMKSRNIEMRAGNARVLMTLRDKGIDVELAKAQIETLSPEDERAIRVAAKFKRHIAESGLDVKLKAKIYRFLGSRGFAPKSIKAAFSSLMPGYVDEDFDPNYE